MSEGVGLYRSTDGAKTWAKVNRAQTFLYPKDFSVHPRDSRQILIGTCDSNWEDQGGGLYRTTNGGRTWQRIGRQGLHGVGSGYV